MFISLLFLCSQGGYSPVPQQVQQYPGGRDYHTQQQPYNPTLIYPAVAVPVHDGYGHGHGHGVNEQHPSHAQGSNFRP